MCAVISTDSILSAATYTGLLLSAVTSTVSIVCAVISSGSLLCAAPSTHSILRAVTYLYILVGQHIAVKKRKQCHSYVVLLKLFIEDDAQSSCCSMAFLLHRPPIKFMTVGIYICIYIYIYIFSENHAVCEITWKNMVQPDWSQITV